MTVQCCVCKRKREGEEWSKTSLQPDPKASHTYCPACLHEAMDTMRREAILAHPLFAR
jgi:hypothetical protein